MKQLIKYFGVAVFLYLNISFAQASDAFKLKYNFTNQTNTLSGTVDIANDQQWKIISNNADNKAKQFIILAKLSNVNAYDATLNFLVLRQNQQVELVTAPLMTLSYAQNGKLTMVEGNQKVELSAVISKA